MKSISSISAEGCAQSDSGISFYFCPSGFPLGVNRQLCASKTEEEEQRAARCFLSVQLLTTF